VFPVKNFASCCDANRSLTRHWGRHPIASAPYLADLFERLGIAEQMQSKTKLLPARQAVADGEAEIGLTFSGGFEPVLGAELLVLLPPALQTSVGYTAGVGASAKVRGS